MTICIHICLFFYKFEGYLHSTIKADVGFGFDDSRILILCWYCLSVRLSVCLPVYFPETAHLFSLKICTTSKCAKRGKIFIALFSILFFSLLYFSRLIWVFWFISGWILFRCNKKEDEKKYGKSRIILENCLPKCVLLDNCWLD